MLESSICEIYFFIIIMTDCKYTFLLPAFKSRFLEEALESIKNQTYNNFKCIVSDDCSPEDLESIYDRIVGTDERFSFRRNEENIGSKSLVSHWNLLVDVCNTDFLIMASDDDIYAPYFLSEIDELVCNYPKPNVFRARARKMNSDRNVIMEDFPSPTYENQYDFLYDWFCLRKVSCIANYVFRVDALRKIGGFVDFPLAWGSDEATIILLSEQGVCNTQSVLFTFRLSGQNISSKTNKRILQRKTEARLQFIDFIKNEFSRVGAKGASLSERRMRDFMREYLDCYYGQLKGDSVYFSWKNMRDIYFFLIKNNQLSGLLEKIHFYWSWIRVRLYNTNN